MTPLVNAILLALSMTFSVGGLVISHRFRRNIRKIYDRAVRLNVELAFTDLYQRIKVVDQNGWIKQQMDEYLQTRHIVSDLLNKKAK